MINLRSVSHTDSLVRQTVKEEIRLAPDSRENDSPAHDIRPGTFIT